MSIKAGLPNLLAAPLSIDLGPPHLPACVELFKGLITCTPWIFYVNVIIQLSVNVNPFINLYKLIIYYNPCEYWTFMIVTGRIKVTIHVFPRTCPQTTCFIQQKRQD